MVWWNAHVNQFLFSKPFWYWFCWFAALTIKDASHVERLCVFERKPTKTKMYTIIVTHFSIEKTWNCLFTFAGNKKKKDEQPLRNLLQYLIVLLHCVVSGWRDTIINLHRPKGIRLNVHNDSTSYSSHLMAPFLLAKQKYSLHFGLKLFFPVIISSFFLTWILFHFSLLFFMNQ